MTKVLYNRGYLVRVTSWENDGDSYKTEEIEAQTKEEVEQIIAFAKMFKSQYGNGEPGIGNMYDRCPEEVTEVFSKFYERNPNFFGEDKPKDEGTLRTYMMDFACTLGLAGCSDFYTRECDKVEVFFFPQDVIYDDLTKELWNDKV